ncbi:MAG: hypothetical protein PHY76_02520 [Patescibacteria group bacterium]|nr:hypothetical protein [Patescibacteria group bacterium]
MFNDLKPSSPSVNENNPQVDDIFADTDQPKNSSVVEGVEATTANSGQQFSGYYANQKAASDQDADAQLASLNTTFSDEAETKGSKKIIKLVLAGVIFILLVILGYIIYLKLIAPKSEPVEPALIDVPLEGSESVPTITPGIGLEAQDSQEENIPTVNPAVSDEPSLIPSVPLGTTTPPIANIDSDGDGLTDEQEMILGTNPFYPDSDDDGLSDYEEASIYLTNPLNSDSDSDGLSDYEEINIYNTDPLNSDTDNDGYSDKTEIDGGYDPNGLGKLSE